MMDTHMQARGSSSAITTMKALAKSEPREGIWQIEAPIPQPGPHQVLIKVRATAICGTDIHIYNWDEWAARNVPVPMIVGHEFSGEIVEVGEAIDRNLRVGQRVSAEGHIINLNSTASRMGRFHLDPDTVGIGVNRQGAFAEYVCVPAFNVIALPDEVSNAVGALLDPLGNAVHTAQQFDLVGENVLVTGAGPIGMMAAAVAKRAGARRVIVTDINPFRLDMATRLFDVRAVNVAHEDIRDVMAQEGIAEGFDVALEMSGSEFAIRQAVDVLIMGGKLAMLGIPGRPMTVSWSDIILKALTIRGVYGREMFTTWRKMLGLIHGGLDVSALVTHNLPFEAFQTGFDAMRSGQSGKVVLNW